MSILRQPHLITPFILAGIAIASYNLTFFAGVSLAGAAVGTAAALGSGPLWIALFAYPVDRTLPRPALMFGQACVICGLGAITVATPQTAIVGLAFGACLSYAAYSMFALRLAQSIGVLRATFGTSSIEPTNAVSLALAEPLTVAQMSGAGLLLTACWLWVKILVAVMPGFDVRVAPDYRQQRRNWAISCQVFCG